MSVIEGLVPLTEDPDLPDEAVRVEEAAAPVEDLDGRPIESDESDESTPVEDLDGRPIRTIRTRTHGPIEYESDESTPVEDLDGRPIESDESDDDGPARSAGAVTAPALGKHPDDPPGATRRMITAIAVVVLILAAVAALTVDGVSKQHHRTGVSSHPAPASSVRHGHTTSKAGA